MTLDSKRRIGGSVIPKIVGLSRFGTPIDAYMELRGELAEYEESDTNEDIDRGNFLEPALREWAAKKLGAEGMVKPNDTLVREANPWFTYSPDGLFYSPKDAAPALLEIKAPGPWTAKEWGEEGTDQVPQEYAVQGQWGLMITGRPVCYFAALIDGRLKVYRMEEDRQLQEALAKRASVFVERYVLPGVTPPLDLGDDDYIKKKYPRSTRPAAEWSQLTEGEQMVIRTFLDAHASVKVAEEAKEVLALRVKEILGERGGVHVPGFGRIDFKNNKDGSKTDWEEVAKELYHWIGTNVGGEAAEPIFFSAMERNTQNVPGARPLVPRKLKQSPNSSTNEEK